MSLLIQCFPNSGWMGPSVKNILFQFWIKKFSPGLIRIPSASSPNIRTNHRNWLNQQHQCVLDFKGEAFFSSLWYFFAIFGHPKFTNNEKTKFPWGLETCDMPWLVKIQCQSLPTLRLRRGKSLSRLDARFILHYCYSHFLRQFKSHSKAHTLGVNQTNDIRSKWTFKQIYVEQESDLGYNWVAPDLEVL